MTGDREILRHDSFEDEVARFMVGVGLTVPPGLQYHEKWNESQKKAFASLSQPTSLVLRTRADRVSFNTAIAFVFDCKCSPKHERSSIEALPAAVHAMEYTCFQAECLYCCRTALGDWGFWIQDLPPLIDGTNIPPAWPDDWAVYFQRVFVGTWDKRFDRWACRGSHDPFMFVKPSGMDWRQLITDKTSM